MLKYVIVCTRVRHNQKDASEEAALIGNLGKT
jgi:hypothetical protein